MSYNYVFTAIRGKQAGREFFVAMCPLKLIPKIFLFDEMELRPEIRAQRVLNRARIPEIASYLVENPKDYVLSSLTACVDSDVKFEPYGKNSAEGADVGNLTVPMSARFLLNDGQHRRAGIEEALKLRPEIGDEMISVVFFIDAGLRRSQQMFADLNRHAVRPTMSLGILYDHRDAMSRLARDLIERVSVFRDMVEKEKTSISNRSTKLFTLSSIYQASKVLVHRKKGTEVTEAEIRLACDFWDEVGARIPEWRLAQQRKVSAADLRENSVHAHGVALHALALMGCALIEAYPADWKQRIKRLEKVDWSRSNASIWEGRATVNGRVSKSQVSVRRTANYLKQMVGLALTQDDRKFESTKPVRSTQKTQVAQVQLAN